jgi:replicative DNA helicase
VGKTSLATDILEHAGAHGICGAMFSLEMPSDQLILRMACSRSRTDWTRYRDNVLRREERQGIGIATAEIAEMPVVFDDTAACTVAGIHAAITRYNAIRPVGLVVVDYLQLMESTGRHNSQNDAVAAMSRGLKLAAKQFKIPFIVLSQLTRGPEADKRRPKLSDLRDSGAIEQNADGVIFLHPTDEGYGPMRQVKLIVAKQRNGPTAEMAMLFHRPYARFEEAIPTEAEDAA